MNKTILIIGIIVVIALLIFKFGFTSLKQDLEKRIRPSDSTKPAKLVDNDKIVIVKNLSLDYLKKAIEQFCNSYNQEQFIAMPRLSVFENQYLITFPYDIDFERFCYFINYIKYANELCLKPDYKPEIFAWCSTKNGDSWMTEEIINKRVILFIPEWDQEHDNVYLTTQYNMGFKLGFAMGESHIKLDKPALDFTNPPTELLKLQGTQTINFD
jgi:hypothetical protein